MHSLIMLDPEFYKHGSIPMQAIILFFMQYPGISFNYGKNNLKAFPILLAAGGPSAREI